ncbi:MAG: hypothetical protein M0Z66_06675 [Thermaerobacter sp.]|nr:hypothetical protein [Thermaerobacter sp.]
MERRRMAALAVTTAMVVAGCGALQGIPPPPPGAPVMRAGNAPTVYKVPGSKPYKGKLPFRMLWPKAEGYNCNLAIYSPGSVQQQQDTAQQSGTSSVQVTLTRPASVEVVCFPIVGSTAIVYVHEVPGDVPGVLAPPAPSFHKVRLGGVAAQEGQVTSSDGQVSRMLMFSRGSLAVTVGGSAPWALLREIALSLHL